MKREQIMISDNSARKIAIEIMRFLEKNDLEDAFIDIDGWSKEIVLSDTNIVNLDLIGF